jgi:CRISPR-associated endonuclease Csy4
MTTHYIDITLLPDPEFSQAHLLSALMSKLHRVLVQLQADDIGISFPRYSLRPRTLGDLLRLHGSSVALQRLMAQPWLQGMRDHVRVTALALAPPDAPHRAICRRQFKTNAERLLRRRMKLMERKGKTAEEIEQAAADIPACVKRNPDLPYAQLRSASTGQPFCLFIEQGPEQTAVIPGLFNSYGLSKTATVPWF